MTSFAIDARRNLTAGADDAQPLLIRAHEIPLTRLIRSGSDAPDDWLRVPPSALAFWLIDNWWRLRWECMPPAGASAEWRMAHELSSIGGGMAWPRLSIWGEGRRIGVLSRSDPAGIVGPVRFLVDAVVFVTAPDFERAVDRFLDEAADPLTGFGSDREALRAQLAALRAERSDSQVTEWRRMEARLGFDPDGAPELLMDAIAQLAKRFSLVDLEEAASATPGSEAIDVLNDALAAAERSRVKCDFAAAIRHCGPLRSDPEEAPWQIAERVTARLRRAVDADGQPLRNKKLGEILGTTADAFSSASAPIQPVGCYGIRLSAISGRQLVSLRSRWSHDRRFELARCLGDAIWSGSSQFGPIASSRTERQKFQRAFAQSLLCPYDDLVGYLGTEDPTDGDLSAAAKHFHVSERVVRAVLVNKHALLRSRLQLLPPADQSHDRSFEDAVEAA